MMRNLADQLREITDGSPFRRGISLSVMEERLFRMLKTTGERATKGRLIANMTFEARDDEGTILTMVMEGRHAMSVGRQVMRRFDNVRELKFADVVKTDDGALVILRARE